MQCSTPKKITIQENKENSTHSSVGRHEHIIESSPFAGASFNQSGFDDLGCGPLKLDTPIKSSFHPMNTSSPQFRTTPHSSGMRSFDSIESSPVFGTAKTIDHKKGSSLCLSDFLNASSTTPSPRNIKYRKAPSTSNSAADDNPTTIRMSKYRCPDDVRPKEIHKKRVAPIRLPPTTNPYEFNASAFQLENNLIGIDHKDNNNRDALKTQISSITTDLFDTKIALSDAARQQPNYIEPTDETINLTKITGKKSLQKLINLYSAIIDLNLTTNILAELSYLLNLLNADYDRHQQLLSMELPASADSPVEQMLRNANNCVYLSIGVLKLQKNCLKMMDMPTIKILLDNERIVKYDKDLNSFLLDAYAQKQQMEHEFRQTKSNKAGNVSCNLNVSYQQENDTKEHFPSTREFTAFNKQRDMFYNILR